MHNRLSSEPLFPSVDEHVRRLVEWMSRNIYEKEQLAAMALLCAVAGENIFLLGPPGTAKSLVARRLKGVFDNARSFEYLMSRFSTPDELFGPISISRLKDDDRYERLTDGYLPSADVVFLDEIWKAGPSIQNTLLTAINEHIYHNGSETVRIPMKVLVAASNELPAKNEGLEALWDRFLVRMVSGCIEDDDSFELMLRSPDAPVSPLDSHLLLTDELYARWQESSRDIDIPATLMAAMKWLRRRILLKSVKSSDDAKLPDFYISDRRWKKAFRLMQTSAFLNGRTDIDLSDLVLLMHCLWNAPECCGLINSLTANALWHEVTDGDYAVNDRLRKLVSPDGESETTDDPIVPESDFSELYNSYFGIENFRNGTGVIAKWDYRKLSFVDETDGIEFIDTTMRMPVVQITSASPVGINLSSAMGKPRKVRLLKCSGGIVVDGTPYSLVRKGGKDAARKRRNSRKPSPELSALRQQHADNLSRWTDMQQRILAAAGDNIFISEADIAVLRSEMKTVTEQLARTEIRINNVSGILS